jgi:hypothetical protein
MLQVTSDLAGLGPQSAISNTQPCIISRHNFVNACSIS